ncbi:hypothetical protein H4W34_006963 [Actinomadura algeriensis]|uniref:Uncharacterized protein n=1 Tax=Actinomadura algeriensis TaxID=1679523 RepID=A0ABR9K2P0_9ACTN|nr:hypothetical protein [Actinomadura algeriensis]
MGRDLLSNMGRRFEAGRRCGRTCSGPLPGKGPGTPSAARTVRRAAP